jgi:predicted metal-dependent hydrolase
MQPSDVFSLTSPGTITSDSGWSSAVLFETPEQIYQRVYRVLKPRSAAPGVQIRFEKFANANSFIRFEDGRLSVRISDLLEGAPSSITEALAFILLGKLFRKRIPATFEQRYRLFLNRREMRRRAQVVRQERGHKRLRPPQGDFHHLEQVFDALNTEYFHGLMARPALGWSVARSRTRLGHFDPSHNTIVISRIFDQAHVPRLTLDYVMFHEMLHLRHPVDHSGSRRCVHTREFKAEEKRFHQYTEARHLLKGL